MKETQESSLPILLREVSEESATQRVPSNDHGGTLISDS